MKRFAITLALVAMVLAGFRAEATELLMPQFGYQEYTLAEGEELDFYDPKGTGNITSSTSSNAFSTVIFHSAAEGQAVQIVFEKVDVRNDGTNYPAYLAIYDGVFDTSSVAYPTTTYEVTTSTVFPVTVAQLDRLDGTFTNKIYTSSTVDGSLSVCYLYKYAKACEGWVAKVRSISLTDMELQSIATDYSVLPQSVYGGKSNVTLAKVNIEAEGILNPYTLTGITLNVAGSEALAAETLKLADANGNAVTATVSKTDDTYQIATDRQLSSGINTYLIIADIAGDAAFNTVITPAVTAVTTTPATAISIEQGESHSATVAAVVCMPSDATTITVDAAGFNFYDDGGPDANVSNNFSGQVTFVPGVEGQKVMVDFSKLDLFNTSSTGYNDILNIYNGTEPNAANLICTLLKETKAVVHSTSADGALTITFASTTGYPKIGWEATVSCFTPQAMTVSEVVVTQASTATVAADDTDAEILTVNVQTVNTEPALALNQVKVTLDDANHRITRVKVYGTGHDSAFSTAKLLGTADASTSDVTITLDNPLTLTEGVNYLHITADISAQAGNGETVDMALNSLVTSNSEVIVENGNPEGVRTVRNLIYVTEGNKSRTVYSSLEICNEPYSSYSEGYEGDSQNRYLTLYPGVEGNVVQLDFTKFNFYYYSYGGTFAKFVVYNGADATGDALFELTTANRNQIPEPVRSTSPDGALTIYFNGGSTNASSSTYGFAANASLYLLTEMVLGEITVSQPETGIIPCTPRAENQNLLKINIATTGGLDPLSLDEVKVNLKGAADCIDRVTLVSTGSSDSMSTDNVVASADIDGTTESIVLTPTDFALSEGDNYLWINVDMKEGVRADREIDASIESITINGEVATVTTPDPEGSRMTRNIYNMAAGSDVTEVTIDDQTLMFYDDGGADAGITKYFSGITRFVPRDENKVVRIDFSTLSLSYGDTMSIYFADTAQGTADVTIDQYTPAPMSVVSTTDSGVMTVKFVSNAYSAGAGWAANVYQYELQPLSIGDITVDILNATESLRGSEPKVMKVTIPVLGDKGEVAVSEVSLDATPDNIVSELNIYDCGTTDSFVITAPVTPGNYSFTAPGTYYWYITATVSSDAAIDDHATVSLSKIVANGQEHTINASSDVCVVSGMHGNYTIGSSEDDDYKSIADAVAALCVRGVDGPTTFVIEAGTYNQLVEIPEISGSSATNTIEFRGATGDADDVVFSTSTDNNTSLIDEIDKHGMLTVRGADYVTFADMSFITEYNKYPAIVYVLQGAQHFTLDNVVLSSPKSTSNYTGGNTVLVKTYTRSDHNEDLNNNLTIRNCTLNGGFIAVSNGSGYVTTNREAGLTIEGSTINDPGSKLVYLNKSADVVVRNNRFNINNWASGAMLFDVDVDGANRFEANRFNATGNDNSGYLFYLRAVESSQEEPTIIANNEIMLSTIGNYYTDAIYVRSNLNGYVNIAHNSILVSSTHTTTNGIFFYSKMKGEVVNNQIEVSGGAVYRINSGTIDDVIFSNNLCYSAGRGYAYSSIDDELTFDEWNAKSGQEDSFEQQVVFEEGSLRPAVVGNLANGKPLSYVTTDIEGKPRMETPTIGAYEMLSDKPTSIEVNFMDTGTLHIADGILYTDGTCGEIRIFDMQGRLSFNANPVEETSFRLNLAQGIYLLKTASGQSMKIAIR